VIERTIDYLQFTGHIEEYQCIEQNYEPVRPVQFYQRGYRDAYGFRIFFGNQNIKAKSALLIASGEPLQNMREMGYTDQHILNWALSVKGKVSRLDLAVTESMEENLTKIVTVKDIVQWLRDGLILSPLLGDTSKLISSLSVNEIAVNETLYIGDMKKRAKRGIFRAYDKGIELSLSPELKTRIELELKREKAHVNARRIAETGDIAGNFRASFDVKHEEFERLMQAQAVNVYANRGRKKKEQNEELDKRWDWLIGQVAPALAKAIRDDKELGYGDRRLTQFLIKSGLSKEMSEASNIVADNKYKQKLLQNGLIDTVK